MRRPLILAALGLALAACKPATPPAAESVSDAPATPPAPAAAPAPAKPFSAAITAPVYAEYLKTLASDEFEGRGPGSIGERATVAYLEDQFKQLGLQPGNGDSWVQTVPMVETRADPKTTLALSVKGQPQTLAFGEQMVVGTRTTKPEVKLENAPLVFAGYGVNAPEAGWNDYEGLDVKGKVVVVLINDPGFIRKDPGLFKGLTMTYYGRWTYKFEEAARQGAVGMLIVHETDPASYGWETVKNSNTNVMFDIVRNDPAAAHPPLEGWIQRDLAVDLFQRAGLDFEALKKQAQTREFQPVQLKDTSFSASYAVDAKVITSKNIAGRVEGSKRPDETVIYSAHWDHLGVGGPDAKGDRIYNGAVDNATGTAALIELGRAFAHQPRPARSVVFLNVTAEEKGLLGSEYYSANPLYPLAKTVGVINMDALDPHGPARNFTISGSAKLDLLDDLIVKAKSHSLTFSPDPRPEAGHFFRSDHFPFAKRGVPAISFGSGNDWVEGGLAAGEAAEKAYTTDNYHQPSDEWHADWSFTGMAHDMQVLYELGRDLANSKAWPNWAQDSEFRAARDASAAERK